MDAGAMTCKVSLFNHKGGVGKTFLTVNIAAKIAEGGRRVALVDTDPQCNLTSYLVENDVVDSWLDQSDTDKGNTLWSALKPIVDAEGRPKLIKPYETYISNVFLIAGDIRLAEFEAEANDFWSQCFQRKSKGFRGIHALSELTTRLCDTYKFDYVFYDSGPSIGPLNRIVLLDSDFFITPVACDLFSLRGIKTLGRTLYSWIEDWETIADLAPRGTPLLRGAPRYLGYIAQQFRTYRDRPATGYSRYMSSIDKEIRTELIELLRRHDPALAPDYTTGASLGEVKDFGTLVTESQRTGLPIWKVGTAAQRSESNAAFEAVAKRIIDRTKIGDKPNKKNG